MVLPTFLLHFLPFLDLGVTIGRKITQGIQLQVRSANKNKLNIQSLDNLKTHYSSRELKSIDCTIF